MYSNENKNGFSILDILVRIVFAGLFIFVLIWLFQKKVPNMTPFYSNVFRENISYMQEAAESYFTDDKMPKEVDDEVKMSLSEMIDKKIVLPFVDKDGKECNLTESYVSITKSKDESYLLKTNLVCGKESDYVLKVLGCHTYCKDNNCNKTCTKEKIISYQYKKEQTGTKTNYSCPSGFKLDNKYCFKTILSDTKSAIHKTTTTRIDTVDAKLVQIEPEKFEKVDTIRTANKSYKNIVATTTKTRITRIATKNKQSLNVKVEDKKTYTDKVATTTKTRITRIATLNKKYVDRIETKSPSTTTTKQVAYSCQKTKTEKQCSTSYSSYSYSCNCSGGWVQGQYVSSCSTCTGSTPVETCNNVEVKYNDTCYKDETVTVPGTTTYSCPSGTYKEGTGSNTKCYIASYTYSCPAEANYSEGKDASLLCYKKETTYSCPSGYTKEGSESNLKCYKSEKTYSCPTESNYKEGTGSNLKCYNITYTYSCPAEANYSEGKDASLLCYKKETAYSCPSGYTKEGTGSTAKCSKTDYTYSCPASANVTEGSGSNLKCYISKNGKYEYVCSDSTYTLKDKKCSKTITEESTKKYCDSGYKLEGDKCNKYTEQKEKADSKKSTYKYYTYKWSTETSLSGWTKTGKTKVEEGKEICK